MDLSNWLARNDEVCDDEQRAVLAINIAHLTDQCSDGHLNPKRIEIADDLSVSLNNTLSMQDEYAAPEILRYEGSKGFVSAVFSYGLILDELLRGSSYITEKNWSTEDFLQYLETTDEWFEPFENCDPLENVLRPCLEKDPSKRPQNFEELKNLLSSNSDTAKFLKDNPQYSLPESQTEDNSAPTETQHSEEKIADKDSDAGLAIGIDLGTSNSTVAYYSSGKYKYVEASNKRLIPSAIYFKETDPEKWIYGDRALRRGIMYPDSLFKHFKRHIGKNAEIKFRVEPSADTKTDKRKYVIDTNIFIEDPNILDGFGEDVEVLVPKTVYQELERRKGDSKTADEAAVALESIDKHDGKLVTLADSHTELLPDDMFKSSDKSNNDRNDSKILSVALFHDGDRTVLLSNDKAIPVKAEWLKSHKFIVQNYNQFSFIRHTVEGNESPGELNLTGKDGAAFFLKYLRELVRKDIGYVSKAVITVPQKFSPIQYSEIKDAGFKAGFTEIELHSEPKAAALAYGLEQEGNKNILIYDFGGGTFDVTIFNINNGNFDPLSSGGDDKLGGEDFTQALIVDFMEKLQQGEILPDDEELDMFDEDASGLSHDEFGKNKIKIWEACESLKCSLSSSEEETKKIQLYVKPGERKEVLYKLSREEFDDITSDLRAKAKKALDETLQNAGLKRNDIDVIIMAGGTSSIPVIAEMVERYFGKKPYADRDPATLIAEGAALLADINWNQDSTIDKKIKIFDRTMTDLGVSLKGRNFDVIIPVKSALDHPIKKEKVYSLVKDNQSELDIEFFTRDEGSNATRTMDDSIRYIGHVIISNLPPLKISEVDVCVTFSLTKEYELLTSAVLKDKQGKVIDQADVTIDTIGV